MSSHDEDHDRGHGSGLLEIRLRVRALERIAAEFPNEVQVRLRLAQALRDAGRLEEAERIYRAELGADTARP